MSLGSLFLILAIIAFGCLAFGIGTSVPWLAIGLILMCLAFLVGGYKVPMG